MIRGKVSQARLEAYAAYYNDVRPHLALAKDAPLSSSGPTLSSADFITNTVGPSFQ
jgi:hypothetical protein